MFASLLNSKTNSDLRFHQSIPNDKQYLNATSGTDTFT